MTTDNRSSQGVFTRERLLTVILAILTFLAIYVCYRIVEPFLPAMAFALALAVATKHPFAWLKRRIGRNTPAAAIAVLLVALLIIGPAVSVAIYVTQVAIDYVGHVQHDGGVASVRATLENQPFIGPLLRDVQMRFRLEEQLGTIGRAVGSRL